MVKNRFITKHYNGKHSRIIISTSYKLGTKREKKSSTLGNIQKSPYLCITIFKYFINSIK